MGRIGDLMGGRLRIGEDTVEQMREGAMIKGGGELGENPTRPRDRKGEPGRT